MNKKITIAIDGHSSCGKSTLARALAKNLGYTYIDTGAMYRALTWYFLQRNILAKEQELVKQTIQGLSLEPDREKPENIRLNDQLLSDELRSMEVNQKVSEYSTIDFVREYLVKIQQDLGAKKGVVMDGRDIGTVVFPDAELKIFLTASHEVRTERRYRELLEQGKKLSREEISHNLAHRDKIDSTRANSPLKKAKDAVILDNSELNREEQLALAIKWAREKIKEYHGS